MNFLPRTTCQLRRFATSAPRPATGATNPTRSSRWWRRAIRPACLTAATGATIYYLIRDVDYVEDARGAHEHVPPLAFRPKTGGPRNLPIVTSQLDDDISDTPKAKPRVVIVGGGWGAVSAVNSIDKDKYDITVVSETNYFLFTPLLPSATVGTLEMRSLLEPMRKITKRRGAHFLEGVGVDIDLDNKLLEVKESGEEGIHYYLPYDRLVIAVGSTSITHGVQGIEYTERLKTIQDAILIRRKVSTNVEKACLPSTSPEERKRLLSFVICGGGATGIEFAAELFDWMNEDLVKWFPRLLREDISVTIIQSRSHILNTFDEQISEYAERRFEREGINIITNARVACIDKDKVVYRLKGAEGSDQREIPYGFCLWSTGIAMTPFAKNLAENLGQQIHKRAILTDAYCRVKGVDDDSVLAIGDCATIENPKLLEHMMEIFENADTNHDSVLCFDEFKEAVNIMRRRFPLSRQHLKELERLFHTYDFDKSDTIDMDEMQTLLKDIDNKMTALPATAQVASQQGSYIGRLLNQAAVDEDQIDENVGPFTYSHLGTLAYLGNTAVGEFKWGYKMLGGLWSLYLWRSVYWSKQVSMRTRANLALDWSKRALFGRDLSTI